MQLILDAASPSVVKESCIPFILKCLGLPSHAIQQSILSQLPAVLKSSQQDTIQRALLPQVFEVIASPECPSRVRACGLTTLAKTASYFHKALITEVVLPAVSTVHNFHGHQSPQMALNDQTPDTVVGAFKLLDALRPTMSHEVALTTMLPIAVSLWGKHLSVTRLFLQQTKAFRSPISSSVET